MKTGILPHPSPDQRLQQPYHVVRLPRKAPIQQRFWRAAINLFEEWRAAMSPAASDRLYRVCVGLATVTAISIFLGMLWWTNSNVHEVQISIRTKEVVRVKDPTGKVVHLTAAQLREVRNKDYVYVP